MKNLFISLVLFTILFSSCTKNSSTSNNNSSGFSLMPMKAGNTWIYQNIVYNSNGTAVENYLDTAYITNQTITISGYTFYQFKDSLGYFGSKSLFAYDSLYYAIYQLDSINASSAYIFFQIAPFDNDLLGTGNDLSNPNCTGTYYTYGFLSTFTVGSYTCYKNVDLEKDCNGNIISQDIYYVSPGVGIVRVESYLPVSSGSSTLYLNYAQTLQSYKLN